MLELLRSRHRQVQADFIMFDTVRLNASCSGNGNANFFFAFKLLLLNKYCFDSGSHWVHAHKCEIALYAYLIDFVFKDVITSLQCLGFSVRL